MFADLTVMGHLLMNKTRPPQGGGQPAKGPKAQFLCRIDAVRKAGPLPVAGQYDNRQTRNFSLSCNAVKATKS
jgi:hypothetical protein